MRTAGDRVRALVIPADPELPQFVEALSRAGLSVRSFEERGQVVLETPDLEQAELVRRLHAAWVRGERDWLARLPQPPGNPWHLSLRQLQGCPGVVAVLLLAVFAYACLGALAQGQVNAFAQVMLIVDPDGGLEVSLRRLAHDREYWRWISPTLVHFSAMHLAFNAAVVYEFGRRIEIASGTGAVLLLVLILGVLANLTQVAFGTSPLFGGLSGVAYGLLGYVLVRSRLDAGNPYWRMHPGVPGSLLFFLVLFSTGVTEFFGLFVANAAHWGGLAAGALLGLIAGRPRTMPH